MRDELECAEALYEDTLWKASKLKDNSGYYIEEMRLKMRKESQNRKFFCPECGENLILNAGNIREPYFRHYDGSECLMANAREYALSYYTREHLSALARRSFPEAQITYCKQVPGTKFRMQILISDIHCKMALNYVSDSTKIERVEQMTEGMEQAGIIPVWFCEYNARNFEKFTTIQFLISKKQSILKFIDLHESRLYLKKYCGTCSHASIIYRDYNLAYQLINYYGEFSNQFGEENSGYITKMIDCNRLPKESLIEYGADLYSFMDDQGMFMQASESKDISHIKKVPHKQSNVALGAVYMQENDEDWFLPKITGPKEDRDTAYNIRKALLYYADLRLNPDSDRMKELDLILGEMITADSWILLSSYVKNEIK